MNEKDLFRACGEVDDALIEEAVDSGAAVRRRSAPLKALCALAACAALALGLWRPWEAGPEIYPQVTAAPSAAEPGPGEAQSPPADGVYIPPLELPETGSDVAACMTAFVIYSDRIYSESQTLSSAEADFGGLLGDYLFTASGNIDEWSGTGDYVDGSGSVGGDVYTVKGYDSSFRLCIPSEDGELLQLFDCLNGITLSAGAELYGERLRLAESWTALEYQTHGDWNAGENRFLKPELTGEQIAAFLDELYAADFERWDAGSENGDIYDLELEQAHLYFRLSDGTTVELRLFENGRVKYDPLPDRVLADVSGAAFDAVFAACR